MLRPAYSTFDRPACLQQAGRQRQAHQCPLAVQLWQAAVMAWFADIHLSLLLLQMA